VVEWTPGAVERRKWFEDYVLIYESNQELFENASLQNASFSHLTLAVNDWWIQ